jgi:hypothetical protein
MREPRVDRHGQGTALELEDVREEVESERQYLGVHDTRDQRRERGAFWKEKKRRPALSNFNET